MSGPACGWANKCIRCGCPKAHAVLGILAEHADREGVCWPNQETIAYESEWSLSTVKRALALLEKHQIIKVRRKRVGLNKTKNLYVLNLGYSFDIPNNVIRELGEIKQVQQTPLNKYQLEGPVLSSLEDAENPEQVQQTPSTKNEVEQVQQTPLNGSSGPLRDSNRSTQTCLNRSTQTSEPSCNRQSTTNQNGSGQDEHFTPPKSSIAMDLDWRPNDYIFESLKFKFGIPRPFAEDVLLFFRLHHNGTSKKQSAFEKMAAAWIREDWDKCKSSYLIDDSPKLITEDWWPSDEVLQELERQGITQDYASNLVPAFRIYWLERGSARSSFGALFIQFCNWTRTDPNPPNSPSIADRVTDRLRQLADRSWAQ